MGLSVAPTTFGSIHVVIPDGPRWQVEVTPRDGVNSILSGGADLYHDETDDFLSTSPGLAAFTPTTEGKVKPATASVSHAKSLELFLSLFFSRLTRSGANELYKGQIPHHYTNRSNEFKATPTKPSEASDKPSTPLGKFIASSDITLNDDASVYIQELYRLFRAVESVPINTNLDNKTVNKIELYDKKRGLFSFSQNTVDELIKGFETASKVNEG